MARTDRKVRWLFIILTLMLSFSLMGSRVMDGDGHDQNHNQRHVLYTILRGAAEVPGPGDADGIGSAVIVLKTDSLEVCWILLVRKITLPATAAHIHVGATDVAGTVVVGLSAPNARGLAVGCAVVDEVLFNELVNTPEAYYVNVHTSDFPAGAVRGQLTLLKH
jgi:hypothetical protein